VGLVGRWAVRAVHGCARIGIDEIGEPLLRVALHLRCGSAMHRQTKPPLIRRLPEADRPSRRPSTKRATISRPWWPESHKSMKLLIRVRAAFVECLSHHASVWTKALV
jgi:hypothetical protein